MSLRRRLAVVTLVYVIEGFPMGVYADVWPVWFRRHGLSLAEIGWLAGLSAAWSAKVLWSPLVDRFGERRQWIAGCLAAMTGALLVLSRGDPMAVGALLWPALALFCLASATQDVAIDAYTIALVDRGEEGQANAVRVTAYRIGLIAAGGGLLFLPRWIGWSGTFALAGAASAAMALATRVLPALPLPPADRHAWLPALRRWLGGGDAPGVLAFVMLYRLGDRAMGPMVKPFWVDRGFPLEEIATVSTTLGALATVAGAVVGGAFVARRGISVSLWVLGILALASNLGYSAAAAFPASGRAGIYTASLIESFCGGLATAAFLSYLMRICEREHAAVQYALLTALYALTGSLVAVPSGWITERVGYSPYFALTAAFALPAFAFLPRAQRWLERPVPPAGGGDGRRPGAGPSAPGKHS